LLLLTTLALVTSGEYVTSVCHCHALQTAAVMYIQLCIVWRKIS